MCNKELKRSAQNLKKKIQEEKNKLVSLLNGFQDSSVTLKNNSDVEKAFKKHARFSFNTKNIYSNSVFKALRKRQMYDKLILWNGLVKAFLYGYRFLS